MSESNLSSNLSLKETEEKGNEVEILDLEASAVSAQSIKDMIDALSHTEDGEPLQHAMRDLKKALLANPTACAMLLPEDIGEMVRHLMKITGRDLQDQQSQSAKKKEKKKPVDFTDEKVLKELEDNLF